MPGISLATTRTLAAVVVFTLASSARAVSAQDARFAAVADSILAWIQQGVFPSAAVAVAKDGRIIYERGFGLADRERGIAADENTSADGSFMLPVPRRIEANVCMNHGISAPAKKICT